MSITEIFIRRPVLSTTVMIAMVVFGAIGYVSLPVSNLPQVEYPTIQVIAGLPGAGPDTIASSVATPLERQFSAIEGLKSMNSTSRLGMTSISLQFNLSRNIDSAAMDVQAAISRASGDLPTNMPSPPTFQKVNPSDVPIYYLIMSSDAMPLYKVTDYARTFVTDSLTTVPGVAQVLDYSEQKFTVRVRMDPEELAAREISFNDVERAIVGENVKLPLGTLDGKVRSRTVNTSGQLMDAEAYKSIIVSYIDGQPVRLGQLGTVENSVLNNKATSFYNGKPCVALGVNRQPGTNTVEIVDEIEKRLPAIRASLPPTVKLTILYDMSQSIRKSIDDVKFTLILAILLVVVVVYLFLRSVMATFVAGVAIPLSIVFTFAVMYLWGFSLDNLSLMALVLAVGFVVDDAIVVLENVVRHMQMGKKPFQAAIDGSREILFTIISMTSSLAVVFVPIMFMAGIYGRILNEFAVTITIAILVSGVVAICVSPMVSSRVLKPGGTIEKTSPFFERILNVYKWTLEEAVRHRRITVVMAVLMPAATIHLFLIIPKGFVPNVDMNYAMGISIAEQGASPEAMASHAKRISKLVQDNPNVEAVLGISGIPQQNQALLIPVFKDIPPRKDSAETVIQELWPVVNSVPGVMTFFEIPPLIQASAQQSASPYQLVLQSADTETLYREAQELTMALRGVREIAGVNSNLYLKSPQAYLHIHRDKAATLGIRVEAIENTLFSAYGERQISNIYGASDTYKVILQVEEKHQRDMDQLSRLYVMGGNGTPVRLDTVADLSPSIGPLVVNHYDQLPSVTISFNTAPGHSLGEATTAVRSLAAKTLSPAVMHRFGGTAQAFEESVNSIVVLLIIAIVVIYMILAILYENFIVPLTIISGLPSAAFGGLLVLWLFGIPLDLFGYVGLFMLIGIVKKNAIMVVDFAREAEVKEGKSPQEAAIQGSLVRFRPIMMTTMAAIAGMIPIAVGFGAGGEARQPLGLAVVGGLLLSQVVTLYLTPVVYSYLAGFEEWVGSRGAKYREIRGIPTDVNQ